MVSVIVPAYNAEHCAEKCLESVLAQAFGDFELICVDNASADGTAALIGRFAARDGRVKYAFCEKRGVSAARNTGLSIACKKYVFFIDADDELLPGALENMVNVAEKHRCGVTAVSRLNCYENGRERACKTYPDAVAHGGAEIAELYYETLESYVWYNVCKLFRRDLIAENNIVFDENVSLGEDAAFTLKVLEHCDCAAYVSAPGYRYNISQTGLNMKYRSDMPESKERLYSDIKNYLERHGQPLENLHLNLTNDMFAILANEYKSATPDFNKIRSYSLAEELIGSGVFKRLPLAKKLFFAAFERGYAPVTEMMVKLWT